MEVTNHLLTGMIIQALEKTSPKEFFTKPALSYGEYKQQCVSGNLGRFFSADKKNEGRLSWTPSHGVFFDASDFRWFFRFSCFGATIFRCSIISPYLANG